MSILNDAKQFLVDNQENMLKDLATLIEIDSTQGDEQKGMPFGKGPYDALMATKNMVTKNGFEFVDLDGYIGYFDFGTDKPEYGVISHVDVVPASENFSVEPFALTQKDGYLYGRGVVDDKGPTIGVLYAISALKHAGFVPKKTIRMIVGTNEETGWKDIDYYNSHAVMPEFGFSPDADYPLINIEKGLFRFDLKSSLDIDARLVFANAGQRSNMVPDKAVCKVGFNTKIYEDALKNINVQGTIKVCDKDFCEITFNGISAHASVLEQGENAAYKLLMFLHELNFNEKTNKIIADVCKLFLGYYHGQGFGIDAYDEESGRVTMNLGVLTIGNAGTNITVDVRYPIVSDLDTCVNGIKHAIKDTGFEFILGHNMPLHHVPKDTPLVEKLLLAYEEETGLTGKPIAIGGATFSRAFSQGVAFGTTFVGEPMVAHNDDERVSLDSFIKNANIMVRAIYNLCK